MLLAATSEVYHTCKNPDALEIHTVELAMIMLFYYIKFVRVAMIISHDCVTCTTLYSASSCSYTGCVCMHLKITPVSIIRNRKYE